MKMCQCSRWQRSYLHASHEASRCACFSEGLCFSEAGYELRVEMVAMALAESKLESVIIQSWPK